MVTETISIRTIVGGLGWMDCAGDVWDGKGALAKEVVERARRRVAVPRAVGGLVWVSGRDIPLVFISLVETPLCQLDP